MKKVFIAGLFALASGGGWAMNTITFHGAVLAATCDVTGGGDSVAVSVLHRPFPGVVPPGDMEGAAAFTIRINDCNYPGDYLGQFSARAELAHRRSEEMPQPAFSSLDGAMVASLSREKVLMNYSPQVIVFVSRPSYVANYRRDREFLNLEDREIDFMEYFLIYP